MNGCCYGGCESYSGRTFLTKKEKIEMLNEYKDYLEKESKGISERITELQGEE